VVFLSGGYWQVHSWYIFGRIFLNKELPSERNIGSVAIAKRGTAGQARDFLQSFQQRAEKRQICFHPRVLKGILQPFDLEGVTRLIRSAVKTV
jgi:hypothetical protein